jgi:hypothetical protein
MVWWLTCLPVAAVTSSASFRALVLGFLDTCWTRSRESLVDHTLDRPDRLLFSIEFVVLNCLITHWTVENDKLRRVSVLRFLKPCLNNETIRSLQTRGSSLVLRPILTANIFATDPFSFIGKGTKVKVCLIRLGISID